MASYFDEYLATAEMQLLLACCRRVAGSMSDEEWSRMLAEPFDETVFSDLCQQHRLSIPVYKMLVRPHRALFSGETIARFEKQSVQLGMKHLQLSKTSVDIHGEFRRENIPHVFLKGSVLNQQLFGDELMRSSVDVDVLIDRRDVLKADEFLGRLGFAPEIFWWQAWFQIPFHKTHHKDVRYFKKGTRYCIELHWKTDLVETLLGPEKFDWKRNVKQVEFHGESMPVFPDSLNCLYLCLHAAKHHWSQFRWLLDISLFMKSQKIDPRQLLEFSRQYGLENVVWEAFFLSGKLFGMDCIAHHDDSLKKAGSRVVRRFKANRSTSPILRPLVQTYLGSLLYPTLRLRLNFWSIQFIEWIFKVPNKLVPMLFPMSLPRSKRHSGS